MPYIPGTNSADTLEGTSSDDQIFARRGDDLLRGFSGGSDDPEANVSIASGADYLKGDDGDDTLEGGDGDDQLFGNDENDQIFGGDGNDILNGGNDDDGLDGGDGDDVLIGGSNTRDPVTREITGTDVLVGGAGDDMLLGDAGFDVMDGGTGQDTAVGGLGNDRIFGGTDDDELLGGLDNDTLTGEGGNDLILAGLGDDRVIGDRDALGAPDGNDQIQLSDGDDTVFAGGGDDTVLGGLGDDFIDGGDNLLSTFQNDNGGDDDLLGGDGNDTLRGGLGRDTLNGGGSKFGEIDFLIPTAIIDGQGVVSADGQQDLIILGNSEGFLYAGGAGDPIVAGSTTLLGQGDRAVIQLFENGVDKIQVNDPSVVGTAVIGSDTFVVVPVSGGFEILAQIVGQTGALAAGTFVEPPVDNSGDDVFTGSPADDVLDGGAGNDDLSGEDGNDTLIGGAGNDNLDGGLGTDAASYESDPAAVQVDLGAQTATDGFGGTDSLVNIEDVLGSAFADNLEGDAQPNQLFGNDGNDTLLGSGGNDTLTGGAGADFLQGTDSSTGGTGELDRLIGSPNDGVRDTFVVTEPGTSNVFYVGNGGSDFAQIEGFELGVDRIAINQNLLDNLFFGNSGGNAVLGLRDGASIDVVALVVGIDANTLNSQTFLTLI